MAESWYQIETSKVLELTGSTSSGLTAAAAEAKLNETGPNELTAKKHKPAWLMFLAQFKDFMILVLIAAAIISGFAGELTDTIIILIIVVINGVIGFVQEYNAEKAIDALKKIAALQATVLRDGKENNLSATQLVPGDVVLLESGNVVPADVRMLEVFGLKIDESALTGESVPVDKTDKVLNEENIPVADRRNMAYKSTIVTGGRAKAVVIATGMQTEIGSIAKMLQEEGTATPLQKRMTDFSKKLSYIILFICLLLFGIGILKGAKPVEMLLISISLAVAAIPEALPALITVALSGGAKILVRKKALIRKLHAVETLGSVTYICTDKTGTLTQNKMKVVKEHVDEQGAEKINGFSIMDCCMMLNQDVKEPTPGSYTGDPTEIAILEYFAGKHSKEEIKSIQQLFPRVAEIPFDADRRSMTTVHTYDQKKLVICKGAIEAVEKYLNNGENNVEIARIVEEWAKEGIRVIAYAYKIVDTVTDPPDVQALESKLIFAGLAGMIDPPREEVTQAIQECKTAGIHTVMITGDHPATAAAIASQIGILTSKDLVVTGKDLQAMSDDEYDEKVEKIRVYARVSPEQKLHIVKSLQKKKHFVSMTGDGVNDAPSLKAADIGVAMGISGTDVSKEAAAMILLDDNFATIVKAVKEGRRIYDNIRKFVKYIMTCNGAEIWTLFLAPLIGLPMPLLPIHILWINMVTDGLPGIALSSEKAEKKIMERPPRKTDESLFADGIGYHIVWVGLLMAGVTLGTQALAIQQGNEKWQTMVFTVLALSQVGHVLAIRSETESLYKQGLFSNKFLLGSVVLTLVLQMAVIYLPFANTIFKTSPLTITELAFCAGMSAIVFHAVEMEKFIRKRIAAKKLPVNAV